MEFYLNRIVPAVCVQKDDQNYGSSATCDVACLQALSQRIHYGKFVAETKFRDPKDQQQYIKLIKACDKEAIETLLTNKKVEESLLNRLRRKALTYGQDITNDLKLDDNELSKNLKINVDVVVELYEKWVIPLTKQVEVEYLLIRLDD